MTEYPMTLKILSIDTLYVFVIIISLWISNRFIIIKFHHKFKNDRNKKKKLTLRYLLSIIVSLFIVMPSVRVYHTFCTSHFDPLDTGDYILSHRMLYLITILFVYFINANYERLFLFMELSEKAVEAEKYKKDSIEAKFKNLKNKINPHFLFNTFNALSEIIEEDPPKAANLVQELSDVYRYVLDNQEMNWVNLEKELNFAYAYISLLKMRFEDNFVVDINIPENVYDTMITPLTMQILIENTVKHNEISSRNKLSLEIFVEDQAIIVRNNLQPKEADGNGTSFGLTNLSERYRFLSDKKLIIQKTEKEFIVKIPIIKQITDEGISS